MSADSWYGAAVIWASENGIVNGVGGGLFDPDASLTREQMAMMLYRFAGYLGSNTEKRADLSAYGDADAVSAFAQDAMAWAVAEGLVNGRSAAELAPKAVQRARSWRRSCSALRRCRTPEANYA